MTLVHENWHEIENLQALSRSNFKVVCAFVRQIIRDEDEGCK